jgi:hypothetical protein
MDGDGWIGMCVPPGRRRTSPSLLCSEVARIMAALAPVKE